VRDLDETDMERVVQLLGKTNQFNLTTRRHTAEAVRKMLALPGAFGITLRLADKFGDAGLVSVVLAVPYETSPVPAIRLDTWLMSCRVIARTTEEFFMNHVVRKAMEGGKKRLIGEFIPTSKNQLVTEFYDKLGFQRVGEIAGGGRIYHLDLSAYQFRPSPIQYKK
jgi:FkbH-like protein